MTDSVQQLAEEIAHQIGEIGADQHAHVFEMSWWSEHMLEWAMAHPDFKTQLFRFVDVFPATHGVNDVVRHMNEYFSGATIPRFVDVGVELADTSVVGRPIAAGIAKNNIERMAHQFIVGEDVHDAEKNLRALWDAGSGCILDLLGEKTVTEAEARKYADRVVTMITDLAAVSKSWPSQPKLESDDLGEIPAVQVSVKPSALTSHYSPLTREVALEEIAEKLSAIFAVAREQGVFVWLDMEQYDGKDITHEAFQRVLAKPEFSDVHAGIVVQAYLKDSYKDLQAVVALSARREIPLGVRLVKGAYWDAETIAARASDWPSPVWRHKPQSDANFERCVDFLLQSHGKVRSAFASHNIRSIAYAIARAKELGIPENGYEIQMLYGMAEPMHAGVRGYGVRHRVYAPIGELVPGMAYLVRRLLENTSNESFVRMRFAEDHSLSDLMAAPVATLQDDRDISAPRITTNADFPNAYSPEPLAEWRSADVRSSFQSAVNNHTGAANTYVAAKIGDSEIRTEKTIPSVDPAFPDRIVAESASCSTSHVDGAIDVAKGAFSSWSKRSARERALVLFEAAAWLRRRRNEIAALEVMEAGKPWAESDADVCEAIDFLEYYGRECIRLEEGAPVQSPPGEENRLTYTARGLVAVISPWNFPLAIPTGQVSAALATGNCVLFKPAEQTPLIASKLYEALQAGGLPTGVLSFLPGVGEEIGAYLVSHPDISVIAFTGSLPVGQSIIEEAAKKHPGQRHIKRVIAEMGGKNAMIVDSDADLDQVIPAATYSAFGFAGQKCSALSRLIVVGKAFDHVIERLRGAVPELIVGDPRSMATQVGPVIDADAYTRLQGIQRTLANQGEVIAEYDDLPSHGYFVGPTVVVPKSAREQVARDELFGPIVSVMKASDFDEALAMANNTDYALTAGCISRSPQNIERATRELRAGNVYINRGTTGAIVGRQPFGGYGLSGIGSKAGGPDYLLQFTDPRAVSENTMRQGFAPDLLQDDSSGVTESQE